MYATTPTSLLSPVYAQPYSSTLWCCKENFEMHFSTLASYMKEMWNQNCLVSISDQKESVDDLKSTSGYAFTLCTGLFSWASNKQNCMALSTAEVEYVSALINCYFSSNLANKSYTRLW